MNKNTISTIQPDSAISENSPNHTNDIAAHGAAAQQSAAQNDPDSGVAELSADGTARASVLASLSDAYVLSIGSNATSTYTLPITPSYIAVGGGPYTTSTSGINVNFGVAENGSSAILSASNGLNTSKITCKLSGRTLTVTSSGTTTGSFTFTVFMFA